MLLSAVGLAVARLASRRQARALASPATGHCSSIESCNTVVMLSTVNCNIIRPCCPQKKKPVGVGLPVSTERHWRLLNKLHCTGHQQYCSHHCMGPRTPAGANQLAENCTSVHDSQIVHTCAAFYGVKLTDLEMWQLPGNVTCRHFNAILAR